MQASEEEFVPEDEVEEGPALIKKLRDKLAAAVKEKQEYLEGWQRTRADFANYKREEAGLSQEREARIKAELAESIIPSLDAFQMALKSPSFQDGNAEWKKGMQALYTGLVNSLSGIGIKSFSPMGEKFDPHKHEALREVETKDESKDHTVEGVERSGYSIGDRIIRPAQVSVYTYKQTN